MLDGDGLDDTRAPTTQHYRYKVLETVVPFRNAMWNAIMKPDTLGASAARVPRASSRLRQRGVVLFIALLVMVALSLAGIALIRSADTATIVAGNLAFKQAAASAVDRGIEQAVEALFNPVAYPAVSTPVIADKQNDVKAQNYFACVQNDCRNGLSACRTLRFRRFRSC